MDYARKNRHLGDLVVLIIFADPMGVSITDHSLSQALLKTPKDNGSGIKFAPSLVIVNKAHGGVRDTRTNSLRERFTGNLSVVG